MINEPICLAYDSFQQAWLEAVKKLMSLDWEIRNLVVQIKNPTILDQQFHESIETFAQEQGMLGPKAVAYTIFPHKLYRQEGNAEYLFEAYNKSRGLFTRLQRIKPGWGTYFRRMTCYKGAKKEVNQLDNIISAIRNRETLSKAAYSIVIQNPGGETIRPRGGPCLNYIAIQAEPGQTGQPLKMGMLAVYRNHDFLKRAYGNYWGLCNLLSFLALESGGLPAPLTCISSRAYVETKKGALKQLIDRL